MHYYRQTCSHSRNSLVPQYWARSSVSTLSTVQSVHWATGWKTREQLSSRVKKGLFVFTIASKLALGPRQPPIQWVLANVFLEVKRLGLEANNSPPSSSDVKNAWSYTSTPKYVFMAWCLGKAQGQL